MLKYLLAGVRTLHSLDEGARTIWGKYGPKVSAIGVLFVAVGMLFQGRFEEISHTDIELALLALGLLGARPNKRSSQDVGIRK